VIGVVFSQRAIESVLAPRNIEIPTQNMRWFARKQREHDRHVFILVGIGKAIRRPGKMCGHDSDRQAINIQPDPDKAIGQRVALVPVIISDDAVHRPAVIPLVGGNYLLSAGNGHAPGRGLSMAIDLEGHGEEGRLKVCANKVMHILFEYFLQANNIGVLAVEKRLYKIKVEVTLDICCDEI
jgi:hypothetical protein